MNKPNIVLTHRLPEDWLSQLSENYTLAYSDFEEEGYGRLKELLRDADALFCLLTVKVDDDLLDHAPRLKVVGNMAVGYDNIDLAACTRRGIPVGNTPSVLTEGTADLAFTLLLGAARKLKQAAADIPAGKWTTWDPQGWLGADLHGATLGIIGMGKIGSAVARRASGFGMRIIYSDTAPHPEIESKTGAAFSDLDSLFAESDFISLHVPLLPETQHLINAKTLAKMKKSAILVNSSRGGVVDQQALYYALVSGQIAAAGLDVTIPEPLPPDHPLLSLPNCIITPHIGSATAGTRKAMAELTCHNIIAGLENKKLPHCVNEEVYQSN